MTNDNDVGVVFHYFAQSVNYAAPWPIAPAPNTTVYRYPHTHFPLEMLIPSCSLNSPMVTTYHAPTPIPNPP